MKNQWPKLIVFALVMALVLIASPGLNRQASALSSGVVISQVYGGGGNSGADIKSDFIELFNRGSSPVSLNGWSVQYASTAGTSWSKTDLTNVTLQPGQYYLIKEADGSGAVPPITTQDVTGTIAMSGTAGKVALVSNNTLIASGTSCPTANVVDFLGFGSATNCSETAPTASLSNTTAALRDDNGCTETDNNSDDFSIVSEPLTPRNTATTFNVCGGGGDTAPTITATNPVDNATNVAANTTITLNFDETVVITGTVSVVGSLSLTQNLTPTTGDNMTFTMNPSAFTAGETVTVTVLGTQVADQDGTPNNMAADFVFDFQIAIPVSVCGDPATLISAVQGNGTASPMDGNLVTIEGIVVGDFQDYTADPPNELSGYFVQEENSDADADPNTSEGIFVFDGQNPAINVAVGDKVRVSGTVDEFGDAPDTYTELVGPLTVQVCSSGNTAPTPASVDLPVTALSDYEKYESMSVSFVDELTVTEVFTLGRYGEVLLAAGGRLDIPTVAAEPGAPAQAVRDANILRSIMLDDGLTNQNPDPVRYPEPGGLSAANTLRGGDTTAGLTGVLHYLDATEDFRVQPTGTIAWSHDNPRPADAPTIAGTLKVVGANVLNYFTTIDAGPDVCGPAANADCRGADSATEFTRQRDKMLNALVEMDADIYGFNELENNAAAGPANDGTDPVLEDIVDGLNLLVGAGTYDFIDAGVIGTDAIKIGIIYKPASVTPVGGFAILDSSYDPDFIDTRSRPVLAQTFEDVNGGVFTVAVAHLKSKGSACTPDDPDTGDLQGNCNLTRKKAAEVMVDWFAGDPTGSGDSDILLIGDLNSYANEDPVDVFVNAGYVDLAKDKIADPYSYVFDGEWGYLDYAFASPSLYPQVAGAAEWHINSDEPIVLDYNTENKSAGQIAGFYSPLPFRTSDHDPMMVGLELTVPDTTDPDVTINQASGQSDPTSSSPINFTAVFSEPVTGFTDADVTLGGTAGATTAVVTEIAPNDGTTYNVAVSGMTVDGTVIASIPAGAAEDGAGNGNTASTSTDNEVTYTVPVVPVSLFISTTAAGSVGPLSYGSEDILKWDGSAWSMWFDGSATGLTPVGKWKHNINALWIEDEGAGSVILSFTQNARFVPGIGPKVDGMDLVRWDGSAYTLYFDGSDVGLTLKTQEKIDGLHILPDGYQPIPVSCPGGNLLISTQGPGRVPAFGGGQIKFGGEDILGFCATNLGSATAGWWYMVLDGSSVGLPTNAIDSISANADGSVISFTTSRPINVPGANGGHSMVFEYDTVNGTFNGPVFSAPAMGIDKQVDALQVIGDLP